MCLHDGVCPGEGIYLEQKMITDADPCDNVICDGTWIEADGIYCDEGCITEDAKNKKKTKTIIKS